MNESWPKVQIPTNLSNVNWLNGVSKNGTTPKNGKVKTSAIKDSTKIAELKKLEDEEAKHRKKEENRKEMEAERQKLLAGKRTKRLADLMQLVQVTVRNLNAVKDDLEEANWRSQ